MIVILVIIFAIPCAMLAYLFFVIGGLGSSGAGPELPPPNKPAGPSRRQLQARQALVDLGEKRARETANLARARQAGTLSPSEFQAATASGERFYAAERNRLEADAW